MNDVNSMFERLRGLVVTTPEAPLTFEGLTEVANLVIRLAAQGNMSLVLDHLFGCNVRFRHGIISPLRRGVFVVNEDMLAEAIGDGPHMKLELHTLHEEFTRTHKSYLLWRFHAPPEVKVCEENVLPPVRFRSVETGVVPVVDRLVSPSGNHQDIAQVGSISRSTLEDGVCPYCEAESEGPGRAQTITALMEEMSGYVCSQCHHIFVIHNDGQIYVLMDAVEGEALWEEVAFVECRRCEGAGHLLNVLGPCPGCDGTRRHPRDWDPYRRQTVRQCVACGGEVVGGPTHCETCEPRVSQPSLTHLMGDSAAIIACGSPLEQGQGRTFILDRVNCPGCLQILVSRQWPEFPHGTVGALEAAVLAVPGVLGVEVRQEHRPAGPVEVFVQALNRAAVDDSNVARAILDNMPAGVATTGRAHYCRVRPQGGITDDVKWTYMPSEQD